MKIINSIEKIKTLTWINYKKLIKIMLKNNVNHIISNQILRSGTSIGANVNESVFAQSKKDFITKMHIALKEANETKYWLRLLHASELINDIEFKSIMDDINNIIGTLVNILKASKSN